jgi:hypothetical protein
MNATMTYTIIFKDKHEAVDVAGPKSAVACARAKERDGARIFRIERGADQQYSIDELARFIGGVSLG